MVDRPFSEHRPIGPFIDIEEIGPRETLGVHGTVMPDRLKSKLVVVYVLGGDHQPFLPKDTSKGGSLSKKIKERLPQSRVEGKRGGKTSAIPMDNQAVVVKVSPRDLPIQDNEVHNVADVIGRHFDGSEVESVIMDTGK